MDRRKISASAGEIPSAVSFTMVLGRLFRALVFFSGHLAVSAHQVHQSVCLAFLVPFHLALWGMISLFFCED